MLAPEPASGVFDGSLSPFLILCGLDSSSYLLKPLLLQPNLGLFRPCHGRPRTLSLAIFPILEASQLYRQPQAAGWRKAQGLRSKVYDLLLQLVDLQVAAAATLSESACVFVSETDGFTPYRGSHDAERRVRRATGWLRIYHNIAGVFGLAG